MNLPRPGLRATAREVTWTLLSWVGIGAASWALICAAAYLLWRHLEVHP